MGQMRPGDPESLPRAFRLDRDKPLTSSEHGGLAGADSSLASCNWVYRAGAREGQDTGDVGGLARACPPLYRVLSLRFLHILDRPLHLLLPLFDNNQAL